MTNDELKKNQQELDEAMRRNGDEAWGKEKEEADRNAELNAIRYTLYASSGSEIRTIKAKAEK